MKRKNGSILALLLLAILIISACSAKEEEKPVTKEEEPVIEADKELANDEEQELDEDERETAQNSAQNSVQESVQKTEKKPVRLAEEIEATEDMVASGNLIIRYYYVHGALEAQVIPEQEGVWVFSEIPKDELVPVSVKVNQKIEIHSSEELIGMYDLTFEPYSYSDVPVREIMNSNQQVIGKGKFYAVLTPNWNENVDTLYILFESK